MWLINVTFIAWILIPSGTDQSGMNQWGECIDIKFLKIFWKFSNSSLDLTKINSQVLFYLSVTICVCINVAMCNYGRSWKALASNQYHPPSSPPIPRICFLSNQSQYCRMLQQYQQIFLTLLGAFTRSSHGMFCLVLYCDLVKNLKSNTIVFTITWC